MPGYGDPPGLCRMLKLPTTAAGLHMTPAIRFNKLDEIPDFHWSIFSNPGGF
jgi:hypothetical protein